MDGFGKRISVPSFRTLRGQKNEVFVLVGAVLGERERGEVVRLLEADVYFVGNFQGVLQDVGPIRESFGDLHRVLEVEAFVVSHSALVTSVFAEPDTEQHVVRFVILRLKKVSVVGGDHRKAHLLGELEDFPVDLRLSFGVVRLDLQVVPVLEEVRVPGGGFAGTVPVVCSEVACDFPGQTRRADHQPSGVGRQSLPIHPRLVVEAFCVPDGGQLDQVLITLHIPGQEHEMVVGSLSLTGLGAVAPITGSHVSFHTDDRLDPLLLGEFVEGPSAKKATVVGEGEAGHLEFLGPVDEVGEAVGSVEERVLGVCVEVDEAHECRV